MKGLGFGGTKEKSMSTNVTFVKEKYMADLASSSKEGKTTNGDENTLPLHPSCGGLRKGNYEESLETQSAPTLRRSSKPINESKKMKNKTYT